MLHLAAALDPSQGLVIKHTPDISMEVISSYVREKWPELGEYVVIGEHSGAETAYFPYETED